MVPGERGGSGVQEHDGGSGASTSLAVSASATASVHERPVGPLGDADRPLPSRDLQRLDDVLITAERSTGLRFATYLGDLGADTRSGAEAVMAELGDDAPYAALLAISPGQRVVEVVIGAEAARRLTDRAARLAVLSVVAAGADGDLIGALLNGVRVLADQAGTLPERATW